MKVAIIYNNDIDGVINRFGMQNKEFYNFNTIKEVANALEKNGHNVAIFDGNKQIIEKLENFMPRVIEGEKMGMVFNMAYGIQGESRYTHIPSLLEMLGIPYVGSSPSGHTLALDKVLTKIIWQNNEIPTPNFWVFNSSEESLEKVEFPVIVKPKMESVSFGLRVVYNQKDLKDAIEFILEEFKQPVLVEQFIKGREFAVGLLGNGDVEAFPVLEIDLEGNPDAIQTVDDKKVKPKNKICPADLPENIARKMQEISKKAFKVLNLRDFSRVDIRMDGNNNIYLLEINSMASLGKTGSYLKAASAAGYNFETLVNRMLDVAANRYFSQRFEDLPDNENNSKNLVSRIRTFLKNRQDYNEKLLRNIINIDTYVKNRENINLATGIIISEMSKLGFNHQVFPQLEVGNIYYFQNTESSKIDYLIIGSIDSNKELFKHENFNYDEQYLYGTGIWENKGGLITFIQTLQSLKYLRKLKNVKIGFLLITDSSYEGRFSKDIINEKSKNAKNILSLNGASKDGKLITSRSGSAIYKVELKLKDKSKPENVTMASYIFSKIISSVVDISKGDPENIIAPYKIDFDSNIFKVIAHGSVYFSIRFNNLKSYDNIELKIKKILEQFSKKKNIQLTVSGGIKREPMEVNDYTKKLFNKILNIARKIDVRVLEEHRWSSSDICHANQLKAKIDGFGPLGEYYLENNERIFRHSLIDKALLLSLLLLEE